MRAKDKKIASGMVRKLDNLNSIYGSLLSELEEILEKDKLEDPSLRVFAENTYEYLYNAGVPVYEEGDSGNITNVDFRSVEFMFDLSDRIWQSARLFEEILEIEEDTDE